MVVARVCVFVALGFSLLVASGCAWVPRGRFAAVESQNRSLTAVKESLESELANLKSHSRDVEDRLAGAEDELASLESRYGIDRRKIANYRRERNAIRGQLGSLSGGGSAIPRALGERLKQLSNQHAALQYDPHLGAARLDTDILFDTGKAKMRPIAQQVLADFANVFRTPDAGELRFLVVGHTDDRRIVGSELRQRYPNNFHLSSARALAVLDFLRETGVPENRLGMGGFGPYQQITSNDTAEHRQQNRRVEIFILGPQVPVVGWTETTPTLY
jgi:flagellar motor protein MotB